MDNSLAGCEQASQLFNDSFCISGGASTAPPDVSLGGCMEGMETSSSPRALLWGQSLGGPGYFPGLQASHSALSGAFAWQYPHFQTYLYAQTQRGGLLCGSDWATHFLAHRKCIAVWAEDKENMLFVDLPIYEQLPNMCGFHIILGLSWRSFCNIYSGRACGVTKCFWTTEKLQCVLLYASGKWMGGGGSGHTQTSGMQSSYFLPEAILTSVNKPHLPLPQAEGSKEIIYQQTWQMIFW